MNIGSEYSVKEKIFDKLPTKAITSTLTMYTAEQHKRRIDCLLKYDAVLC